MKKLSEHYEQIRRKYPYDKLLLLFDIDGTILDTRYLQRDVLQSCDRARGTDYFAQLTVEQISSTEEQIIELLERFCPQEDRQPVFDWYQQHRWDSAVMQGSAHPYSGVMAVIRWFQMQDNTFVGLNTARPDVLRLETLCSLNRLGREYRVSFASELLFMGSPQAGQQSASGKLAGVQYFKQAGFRVIAMIDNQMRNLQAVARHPELRETLLMHSHQLFATACVQNQGTMMGVPQYDPAEFICREKLPRRVQMVWIQLEQEENLRQFLSSSVHWGGLSLNQNSLDPVVEDKVIELLDRFRLSGRGLRLSLNGNASLVDKLSPLLACRDYIDTDLWFEGRLDLLGESGFRALARRFPGAVLQCPLDFLMPLMLTCPSKAEGVLDMMMEWGINRWSISWQAEGKQALLEQMEAWGFDVDITELPNMSAFLQAVLLLPRSITTDFTFPACLPASQSEELHRFFSPGRKTAWDRPGISLMLDGH